MEHKVTELAVWSGLHRVVYAPKATTIEAPEDRIAYHVDGQYVFYMLKPGDTVLFTLDEQ